MMEKSVTEIGFSNTSSSNPLTADVTDRQTDKKIDIIRMFSAS